MVCTTGSTASATTARRPKGAWPLAVAAWRTRGAAPSARRAGSACAWADLWWLWVGVIEEDRSLCKCLSSYGIWRRFIEKREEIKGRWRGSSLAQPNAGT